MKTIEINTTQNVTIKYELASILQRGAAWLLDFIFIVVAANLLVWLLSGTQHDNETTYILTILPVVLFYTPFFEIFRNGQTPGKMILGLKVIRLDGKPVHILDYLLRWIFRPLDIYSTLLSVGFLSMISTRFNQRVGDLIADTSVAVLKRRGRMQLEQLMKLEELARQDVMHPEVEKLTEDDVVLVKETLDRHSKQANEAHTTALELVTQQVCRKCELPLPTQEIPFLQQVIKDYIVLTR